MLTQIVNKLRYSINETRIDNLKFSTKQVLEKLNEGKQKKGPLHIVYVLNHVGVCGGTKVILEHANGLKKLGAEVTLISNFPKPDWFNIEANYISVPFQLEITRHIPDCDVIVATYWEHISACVEVGIAPVIYFEQGDFHLYEWDTVDEKRKSIIYKQLQLPFEIMTVSNQTASVIRKNFNREAKVVHNSLNNKVFFPKAHISEKKYMLIVGREETKFKGIDDLKKVFLLLKEKGYDIELVWVTQTEPANKMGKVVISPSQDVLGQIYREAFVYVNGSYYESFPLPPLEAMASGTPVVTTNNIGVNEYAEDMINCLMVEPGDIEGMVDRVEQIINNHVLYQSLQEKGLETAKQYNWDTILQELLEYFREISMYKVVEKYKKDDWNIFLNEKDLESRQDAAVLNQLMAYLDADQIQLPVEYEVIPGMPFVRWETMISRKEPLFDGKVEKVFIKIKGNDYFIKSKYTEGVELFLKEEFLSALKFFMGKLQGESIGSMEHGILAKWVSLCLFELKMDDMLLEFLEEALKVHYRYTDLYYIKAMMHFERQEHHQAIDLLTICSYIQDGCFYEEHILNINKLSSSWTQRMFQLA